MGLWIAYLAAALGLLAYKYVRYLYHARRNGKTGREATLEWLFEPSVDNVVSWLTTIAVVWVVGAVYIDSVVDYLSWVPRHPALAFLLGILAEKFAPDLAKYFVSRTVASFTRTV